MRKITLSLAVLAALAFAFAGTANATTQVTANYLGVVPANTSFTIHLRFTTGSPTPEDVNVYTGVYTFKATASNFASIPTTGPSPTPYFGAFCFDSQDTTGSYTFTVISDLTQTPVGSPYVNPTGPNPGHLNSGQVTALEKLFKRDSNPLWTGPSASALTIPDPEGAIAFQLAVWEIVWEHYQSSYSLSSDSGSFWVTGSYGTVITRANAMLADAAAPWGPNDTTQPELVGLVNNSNQDMMWIIPGGSAPLVPEPLTMLGMFLGVGSVGAYIRKRRMA